jgi:hypothetical protein
MPTKELPVPEILAMSIDTLNREAAFLRVISLGRPKSELTTLNHAAEKITRLEKRLERLAKA